MHATSPYFVIFITIRLSVLALLWHFRCQRPGREDLKDAQSRQNSSSSVEHFTPSTTFTLLALMILVACRSDLSVSFVLRIAATLNGSRWEKEPLGHACAAAMFKPSAASFGSHAASSSASPLRRSSLLNTCENRMLHNNVAEGCPSLPFPPLAGLS